MTDNDKKKQIEEMARVICDGRPACNHVMCHEWYTAKKIYDAGYRKHVVGEWTRIEVRGKNYAQVYYQHNDCEVNQTQMFPSPYNSCPNCGARMKGGESGS